MSFEEIIKSQIEHWKRKANENVGTVQAVGSESVVHKYLRYEKLSRLFEEESEVTVHDIGAGVGDFYGWLKSSYRGTTNISYSASEITPQYCEIARQRYPDIEFYNRDILSSVVDDRYDYVILSGVFHQLGSVGHGDWIKYMNGLLKVAWSMSNLGIGFNVLTSHADFFKPGNFYADLTELQLFIVRNLSRFYRMDCDYPLFEATFFVRKQSQVKNRYPESEFSRYLGAVARD